MSEETKKPPKTRRNRSYDWDALKIEWLKSGLRKREFLKTKGINPSSGSTYDRTKDWKQDLKKTHEKVTKAYLAELSDNTSTEIVDNLPDDLPERTWKQILEWRYRQSASDWTVGDMIRVHCKAILHANLVTVTLDDGTEVSKSTLKPNELRSLARCLESTQKIQRLAIGLSTDNIGVSSPQAPDSNTEQDEDDDGVPTFEVLMSKRGKFRSVRPRLVSLK